MNFIAKIFFTLFIFCGSKDIFAQKSFIEGALSYSISISSSKAEAPVSNSLNGAVLNLYLKPEQSRTDMISSLGTETNVYNNKTGKGFILKEYSGQKLMITLDQNNWVQKNQWNDDLKFTISNEVQDIAGYKCKKATGTTDNGKIVTVFFTPDIVITNKKYNSSFSQLPGLPVQYELNSGNLIFKYTLTNINYDPIATVKFDIPKTGFRIMTYDENQQLKKGEK